MGTELMDHDDQRDHAEEAANQRILDTGDGEEDDGWPADPAYEAWCEYQESRGELAGVAEDAPCYPCGQEARKGLRDERFEEDPSMTLVDGDGGIPYHLPFITRKITALGHVVEAHRDPTQSYKLECGHVTI